MTTLQTGGTGASLSLIAISGSNVDSSTALNTEIKTACYSNSSNGVVESMSIVDTTWTYITKTYPADTTCSNTPSVKTITAALTIDTNVNINGWIDGQGQALTTLPTKASDPTTSLTATEMYTRVNVTVTTSGDVNIGVGFTTNFGFVIDDSHSSGVILYRVDENGFATNADPYTNVVSNGYMSIAAYSNAPVVYVGDHNPEITKRVGVGTYFTLSRAGTDSTSFSTIYTRYNYTNYPKSNGAYYDDAVIKVSNSKGNYTEVFVSPQTYTGASANVNLTMTATINGALYIPFADGDKSLVITSAGEVGQPVTGVYGFVLCHYLAVSGSACNGATLPLQGEFSLKRSADVSQ